MNLRRLLILAFLYVVVFPGESCLAESPLFKAFFDQRETVAAVLFERGSSKLSKMAIDQLESSLEDIRKSTCESRMIRIEGFAGREGSAESNFRLSMNRAYSVSRFLENRGIPCLVGVNGYGDLRQDEGNPRNDLRVEIAAYPSMFIFDFDNARIVDEVTLK